jgi:hypothetical protein
LFEKYDLQLQLYFHVTLDHLTSGISCKWINFSELVYDEVEEMAVENNANIVDNADIVDEDDPVDVLDVLAEGIDEDIPNDTGLFTEI